MKYSMKVFHTFFIGTNSLDAQWPYETPYLNWLTLSQIAAVLARYGRLGIFIPTMTSITEFAVSLSLFTCAFTTTLRSSFFPTI